jgi:hypothetical protein
MKRRDKMKDKRLDALLDTLPKMVCYHHEDVSLDPMYRDGICQMERNKDGNYPNTSCYGDIRKCERE